MNRVVPLQKSTLIWIVVAVAVLTIAAFWASYIVTDPTLSENLQRSAFSLIFVALLGGVVKIVLDDFDRRRQQRADYAQFIRNVLDDLKAVGDRVERARILLPAHQSARTFGNEMRDLIESRVQLLAVSRALKLDPYSSPSEELKNLQTKVNSMEKYLRWLINGFETRYKEISDLQRIHEARIDARIKECVGKGADNEKSTLLQRFLGFRGGYEPPELEKVSLPVNTPWEELCKLEQVKDFISLRRQAEQNPGPQNNDSRYDLHFKKCLDEATEILRAELRAILG